MQLTSFLTFIALATAGVSAMPGKPAPKPPPPPPSPPVINHQVVSICLQLYFSITKAPSNCKYPFRTTAPRETLTAALRRAREAPPVLSPPRNATLFPSAATTLPLVDPTP
ncbi:hypothetical protein F5882DRAFT_373059 [Hyaloscypha sp. PMI_1271]|nr:hypothetical protein F5882DRAFT_373059 [Hyaloscypha sp. PMI_1271]